MQLLPFATRLGPREALARLADEPGAMLLEVPDTDRPVALVGCRPVSEMRLTAADPDPLGRIASFLLETPPVAAPFPLAGGVVAALTYELGRTTVGPRLGSLPSSTLLAVLRRYDPLLVFDRREGGCQIAATAAGRRAPWLCRLDGPGRRPYAGPITTEPLAARRSPADYRTAVARIHEHLLAGDIYQANLTQPFVAPMAATAFDLSERLAASHPAAYSAYLDLGDQQIVANSPELFLRQRGRHVETRPIKGTRPRGATPTADGALAEELRHDAKEQAEHVMIVDLERNDLGRVCTYGSVRVERFATVETHPTVHHLVSTVCGTLRDDIDLAALLAATFPGGSITGAPKRRAMEIIDEVEPWPRGIYCGALGLLDPRGNLELGLPIRTAVVCHGMLAYHAGGGIVLDSDPDRELSEAWLKTAGLRRALGEEQLRCSSG